MSHAATNWAIKQRGLKPIAKLVLWHLADCHNPTAGCFPTQDYLASECEVSRASVNRYLDELETIGLIRREPRVDQETKRQLPTRYLLACEDGFEPLDVATRVSTVDTEETGDPCLNSDDSRVSENAEAVSHSYDTLTSKGTGKENQEKNARERFDPTDGVVRLDRYADEALFKACESLTSEVPSFMQFKSFPAAVVAQARQTVAA